MSLLSKNVFGYSIRKILAEFTTSTRTVSVRCKGYTFKLVKGNEKANTKELQMIADIRAERLKVSRPEKRYAEQCLALLLLPYHLGESLGEFVNETVAPSNVAPYNYLHRGHGSNLNPSTIEVYADGVLVCKAGNLVRAFCLLLATFYVFHIAYPKKCTATLIFLQKWICNIQDGVVKIPKAIDKLLVKLAKC